MLKKFLTTPFPFSQKLQDVSELQPPLAGPLNLFIEGPDRFFGIWDLVYLKAGIGDFSEKGE